MEPMSIEYKDFPASKDTAEGMKSLPFESYERIIVTPVEYDTENHLKILYIHPESQETEPRPLLFLVKGSAWKEQILYSYLFELYEFAKRGYNIAIVQYRGTSYGPFPMQLKDSKRALKFMADHAKEYNFDRNNIFLWGDSSGGHTVIMMAVTHNRLFQEFTLPQIRGVIDFYGPSNIKTMGDFPSGVEHKMPDSPEGLLIGGYSVTERTDLADEASALPYISKEQELVPFLIMHGNRDRTVPFHQSIELYEKLKECGKEAEFYSLEEADHGGCYFWHKSAMDVIEKFVERNRK